MKKYLILINSLVLLLYMSSVSSCSKRIRHNMGNVNTKIEQSKLQMELSSAARIGDVKKVSSLLSQEGISPDKVATLAKCMPLISSSPPLYLASVFGHTDVVELLLQNGANPNLPAGKSYPICCAARAGHADVVQLLIAYGANINQANDERDDDSADATALYYAAWKGHKQVVRILLKFQGKRLAIDKGDERDSSPLWVAAICGHSEIAKILIAHGANVNKGNRWNETPLLSAIYSGHIEIVKLLLDHGANIEQTNNSGTTPLAQAVSKGHVEIVKLLLAKGAKSSNISTWWNTAIAGLGSSKRKEIQQLLEEAKNSNKRIQHSRDQLIIP